MKHIILFSLLGFISCLPCASQTISGHWFGVGKVQLPGSYNQYLAEIVLRQNRKKVNGEILYYFKDSLFTNSIKGTYDSVTRQLVLNKFPVVFYRSANLNNSVECEMTGDFTMRISKAGSLLTGNFISDEDHKHVAPPINFILIRSNDTALFVNIKDSDILTKAPVSLPEITGTGTFEQREKIVTKEIEVNSSTIQLELYDNGEIDNDSVSVFVNNKLVLPETMLSNNAIKLTVQLDPHLAYTDISMFANNLGKIPPNTAALILYDDKTRYEIQMSSNLKETATIRLKKKK